MKVFISYRRDDSAGHTGRLHDSLRERLGADNVFLDLSDIGSGQKFADVIQSAIRSCDLVLAVIGREWLTPNANGQRRIDESNDLVRAEIATAFDAHIPVIPVLVNGARPPAAASLPEPLQALAALDAHEITDGRWTYDVERLIDNMQKLVGRRSGSPAQRRWYAAAGAIALIVALSGGLYFWFGRADAVTAQQAIEAPIDVAGEWVAEVSYPWGVNMRERLVLRMDGASVSGTASFLGVPRAIVNGTIDGSKIAFQTRTQEITGDGPANDLVHQYRGSISGSAIAFTMQTQGGNSPELVEFTASRR